MERRAPRVLILTTCPRYAGATLGQWEVNSSGDSLSTYVGDACVIGGCGCCGSPFGGEDKHINFDRAVIADGKLNAAKAIVAERLVLAIEAAESFMIPGMNWTDEIGVL